MKIVCASCQEEGELGLLGEQAPHGEPSVTYGLCSTHRLQMEEGLARMRMGVLRQRQEDGKSMRRRFPRLPVALPAIGRTPQFREMELCGMVRYVGAGGMMVEFPAEVLPGSILRVALETRHGPLEVEGRVVWTSSTVSTTRHGLAFPEPKGPDFAVEVVAGSIR